MVIFHSYVKLPEGNHQFPSIEPPPLHPRDPGAPPGAVLVKLSWSRPRRRGHREIREFNAIPTWDLMVLATRCLILSEKTDFGLFYPIWWLFKTREISGDIMGYGDFSCDNHQYIWMNLIMTSRFFFPATGMKGNVRGIIPKWLYDNS